MNSKDLLKITGLPVLFASLCCLSPLVLVFLGLSSVSFASSLADTFYGQYKWAFRSIGIFLLVITTLLYFRHRRGICSLDAIRKKRREIINSVLIILITSLTGYLFFLYIVVHYLGVFAGVW